MIFDVKLFHFIFDPFVKWSFSDQLKNSQFFSESHVSTTNNRSIQIFIKGLDGKHFTIYPNSNDYIEDIKELIYERIGLTPCKQRLIWAGKQLEDDNTLQDYSIPKDSTIHLVKRLKGGKPVIYLYPEQDNFDVSVNIDMKKEDGEITTIYPVIKGKDKNTWIVKANKSGELTYNNRKHYYLFWECLFNKTFDIDEGFCIEGNKCYEFFEEKLQYIGLKENEANDFITYWCPKMEHSNYVLIKFQGED